MERGVDGIISHITNSSFTCQPVYSSTHTNHILEVKQDLWGGHPLLRGAWGGFNLNYELCILNYT